MNSIGQILGKGAVYRQLLQTDEWRKFSENVRQNYGGCCNVCKRRTGPTHVHHLFYDPNRLPWEYATSDVVLLCQVCHEQLHEHLQKFRRYVFSKLTPRAFQVLNGALAVGLDYNDPLELCHAIANMCASPNSVKRFAHDWSKLGGEPLPAKPIETVEPVKA